MAKSRPAGAAGDPEGGKAAGARRRRSRSAARSASCTTASRTSRRRSTTRSITITDAEGHVIAWSSAGGIGFKGSRKGHAVRGDAGGDGRGQRREGATACARVEVRVKGPGAGRESAIRALQTVGIDVKSIRDVTPIPHNGCRPPKRRRV